MKVNRHLLPIKAHYFFFMAAMGPILPQLSVYGKELGISSVVMGSVTGILPILFLISKPVFGLIVDIYRDYRKVIFMGIIVVMTTSFALMNFIPKRPLQTFHIKHSSCDHLDSCNVTDIYLEQQCQNDTTKVKCISADGNNSFSFDGLIYKSNLKLCSLSNDTTSLNSICNLNCVENIDTNCLYKSATFWTFIVLMSVGSIGFNVVNSISDAICFDVIGDEYDYGKQRVWGTIGFGVTALLSGYIVDYFSVGSFTYTPAFIVMLAFSFLDFLACLKLKLPIMQTPDNIFKDLFKLLNNKHTIVFITFAVFAGILDSFIIYFLFWYVEDLAIEMGTTNVKLLEGLIVAAETLGGEVIFFTISGKILERFGHVHSFSMCFINYALRLGLISIVPSAWWILPIEFVFQGPSYALTYTTIVAYANAISPPGTSATMQGIAAGMDDGFGYAVGSVFGGFLYRYLGGRGALHVFCAIGVVCSIVHLVLHKTVLIYCDPPNINKEVEYKSPTEANLTVLHGPE